MRYRFAIFLIPILCAGTALALDLPTRKAGLWQLTMNFTNTKIPPQTMRQCIDGATDKLLNSNFGGAAQQTCSKQDMTRSGATITVDSVCNIGGATNTSHAVITGSFDSAYTMQVTSKRVGGPSIPGMHPTGETHMSIAAKWLGPCQAGQKPGDMVMANGMKVNVLELQKLHPPGR